MPELRSPLTSIFKPGDYGAIGPQGAGLALSEKVPGALVQIAGWQDFAEASAPALKELGFEGLGDFKTVRTAGPASCLRIAPDKLLLRHDDAAALEASLEKLDTQRTPTLDLSHARWLIEINGPQVEALLSRLTAIDFFLSEFPQRTFVQTGIHQVNVLIQRPAAEKFQLFVPVTWTASMWEVICETALPLGYRIATP
jgi:methylglutamate dehydrogenase subunit D